MVYFFTKDTKDTKFKTSETKSIWRYFFRVLCVLCESFDRSPTLAVESGGKRDDDTGHTSIDSGEGFLYLR